MPRRGENIFKRKDGRWEGRYIKGRDENGKAKYGSVYGKKYGEVKEKLFEAKQNMMSERIPLKPSLLFEEVLELWMETNQIRYKAATESRYRYLIDRHIVPELGKIPVQSLTALRINTFLQDKLETGRLDQNGGLSPSYVRSMMLIINSALQLAVQENICSPLKTPVYKLPPEKKALQILNRVEQEKLERYLYQDLNSTKLGILISLYTGMRIGEVCALRWEDIDWENGIINVHSTVTRVYRKGMDGTQLLIDSPKTKASKRSIPIPSVLLPVIYEIKKGSKSDFVISDKETFLNPRTYEYRYHRILEECGIEDMNYHILRHTFATRCIEVGMDMKSLSEIMGHASISITMNTYVHSSLDLKRTQIEKLSALSM